MLPAAVAGILILGMWIIISVPNSISWKFLNITVGKGLDDVL